MHDDTNSEVIDLYTQGYNLTTKNDFEGAREAYRQALALQPISPRYKSKIYTNLAFVTPEPDEAIRLAYLAVHHYPGSMIAHKYLLRILIDNKRYWQQFTHFFMYVKNVPAMAKERIRAGDEAE